MTNYENPVELYEQQLRRIIDTSGVRLSDIKPSAWTERNVVMGQPRPGPYRYTYTPYCKEIIDRLAPDDPAKWIAFMKGLQIGASAGVIIPGLGWIIQESPANTYFTVGAPDLIEKATDKLDLMIDKAGLRSYIKPQANRKKNMKSGDTNTKKDFAGGFINITTPNNHKEWRDVSLRYGFIDDFEAAKSQSKESGSTRKLMEGRFAAYKDTHKIFYISTPELKEGSNIEPAYLLGDQRKFLVPCPCCGEFIELRWNVPDGIGTIWEEPMPEGTGIVWKLDDKNKVIDDSVGYVCQSCKGFFKDNNKLELLNLGYWQPTGEPSQEGFYSYHLSSLYAPPGMYDWKHYVHNYMEANPVGQPRNEGEYKTFVNTCLGITYIGDVEEPKATQIQNNLRPYKAGTVPSNLSVSDGNGRIVLLTFACDCNGTVDDARIDWVIVAHSASGSTYTVAHGSIGTFIPRENTLANKVDRVKWTYEHGKDNSVWAELENVIYRDYVGDDGMYYRPYMPGIDIGYHADYIWPFIDSMIKRHPENPVVGVRGQQEERYKLQSANMRIYEPGKARTDSYYFQVGFIKDRISNHMKLLCSDMSQNQPPNFMNFPQPDIERQLFVAATFFSHFEAEHRTTVKNKDGETLYRWVKKNSAAQNHMFDCVVYNYGLKEVIVKELGKLLTRGEEEKAFSWSDYVQYVTS